MKKHYLIYSFLLFLAISIFSCEKAIIEEIPATQVTTRSGDEYPGIFQNISTNSLYPGGGMGVESMTGDIYSYTDGVEYDFLLVSEVRGPAKCAVWAPGAEITANGKNYFTIWGVNGKQVRFTIRFQQSCTKVHLAIENSNGKNIFVDGKARLVIEKRKCNGELINNSPVGDYDLNVDPRYHFCPDPGFVDGWICNQCGRVNELSSFRCRFCR